MKKMRKVFITLISLLSIFMIGCQNNAMLSLSEFGKTHDYKVPYENGFFFDDNGKQKILIKFFEDNILFLKDTSIRIHIYICGSQKDIKKSNFKNLKVFIIKVGGGSVFCGFLHPENLKIKYKSDSSKTLIITGKFKSDYLSPPPHSIKILSLTLKDLSLSQVNSMEELQKHSNDFFKERLKEFLGDEWK